MSDRSGAVHTKKCLPKNIKIQSKNLNILRLESKIKLYIQLKKFEKVNTVFILFPEGLQPVRRSHKKFSANMKLNKKTLLYNQNCSCYNINSMDRGQGNKYGNFSYDTPSDEIYKLYAIHKHSSRQTRSIYPTPPIDVRYSHFIQFFIVVSQFFSLFRNTRLHRF